MTRPSVLSPRSLPTRLAMSGDFLCCSVLASGTIGFVESVCTVESGQGQRVIGENRAVSVLSIHALVVQARQPEFPG